MKHLLLCREYPPAPGGGIGTYAGHMARLLAENGEVVHVISQQWQGADRAIEEQCQGRLIIHRVPCEAWPRLLKPRPHAALTALVERDLFASPFPPQCFSWQASLLAERLVEQEGIDLIEAQEYEAPLYYFQLRRALGYGPKRYPICVVHLHSPTEFIAHANGWDLGAPALVTAKRLESYSITAADALLCPSRYLAHQVEDHYGLEAGSIQVIPYPMGVMPLIERGETIWQQGTVCYVGRLERRKGILEWLEAATTVAWNYPTVRFEFLGANILDDNKLWAEELLERQIPRPLRAQFLFHGEQKRAVVTRFLARARFAVVPSRWENFPNTCIEAMASGLPVLVSRQGGMVEMIEDNRTGWIAPQPGSVGLVEALRRALATPSLRLAAMGQAAAASIRHLCDNQKVVQQHLDIRHRWAAQRATRSLSLAAAARQPNQPHTPSMSTVSQPFHTAQGIAIVVICTLTEPLLLNQSLQSIVRQTRQPVAVVVVLEEATQRCSAGILDAAQRIGWQVVSRPSGALASARQLGLATLCKAAVPPLGIVFLESHTQLDERFLATCEHILRRCPDIGLVSCWVRRSGHLWIQPCPSFPYQWLWNDAVSFSAMRTSALQEKTIWQETTPLENEAWYLVNAVLNGGWAAVTLPETLGSQEYYETPFQPPKRSGYGRIDGALMHRFPELLSRDAKELLLYAHFETAASVASDKMVQRAIPLAMARLLWRHPRAAWRILRTAINKMALHLSVWMAGFLS